MRTGQPRNTSGPPLRVLRRADHAHYRLVRISQVAADTYGRVMATQEANNRGLQALEGHERVAVDRALVEEQLVTQACAAAGLDSDAQVHVIAALLVEQRLGLRGSRLTQRDAVRRHIGLGFLDGHGSPSRS